MKAAAQAPMNDYGVLDRLIYGRQGLGDAEPIARILGLVHLYRASGVHLLAFFMFLNFAVLWTGRHAGFTIQKSKIAGLLVTFLTIFWIWNLQDFRLTLIRPVLTFLIRLYFKERGARARIAIPLVLTFLSECLLSRDSSLSSGALHYYLSVAGGLFAYHLKPDLPSWKRHLILAVGSWLPIALLALIRDHEVSYLTPFYSLVSLPVITLVLYPATLIDVFLHHQISDPMTFLWQKFLDLLFALPDFGPTFSAVSRPAILVALPLAMGLGIFRKRISHYPWVFSLVFLSSASFGRDFVQHFEPAREIVQLDVHQGDGSILKDGQGRTEMVDAGSLKTYASDSWIQKLAQHNVTHVDAVMLSHLDEDHCGALKELLLLMPVDCIETNAELWSSPKGRRLQRWVEQISPRTRMQSSGCMRLPKVAWFKSKKGGGNELMGGLVFPLNSHTAYFALGDGDEEQELQYEHVFASSLSQYPDRIWKISHHGSRFSSNFGFLSRMNAREYWISVGAHNTYHHPNPLTLTKLSFLGAEVHRTDVEGDMIRSFSE